MRAGQKFISLYAVLSVANVVLAADSPDPVRLQAFKDAGIVTPDTMVYLPMDEFAGNGTRISNYADVFGGSYCPSRRKVWMYGSAESCQFVGTTPGDGVTHVGRTALSGQTNDVCCRWVASDGTPNTSGYLWIDDPNTDMITAGSFTIEMFVRYNQPNRKVHYLVADHLNGGVICVQVGTNGRIMTEYYAAAHDEFPMTDIYHHWPQENYADGKWHHLAMVYDIDTHTASTYVDYALIGSDEIALPFSGHGANYSHMNGLMIGRAGYKEGSQLAASEMQDGQIDEIRITRRALTRDEFLFPYDKIATDTLAYLSFEDGNLNLWPYPITRGPTSVRFDPWKNCLCKITNDVFGAEGVRSGDVAVSTTNTKSLAVNMYRTSEENGTDVMWRNDWLLREATFDALTIEFFCRGTAVGKWDDLISYLGDVGGVTDKTLVGVQGSGTEMHFRVFHATDQDVSGFDNITGAAHPGIVTDGRWHHVAAVWQTKGGMTSVTAYFDRKKVLDDAEPLQGRLIDNATLTANCLRLGRALAGEIDEIRIMKRALSRDELLRRNCYLGAMLIVR